MVNEGCLSALGGNFKENSHFDELKRQVAAINRSHCVLKLAIDGTILDANDLFLAAMGYEFEEIVGRHHRMFIDAPFAYGSEYANFWRSLERGECQSGEFRRIAKGGREVWLQACYNPITDGHASREIIEYATVITDEKLRQADHQGQIAAINKALCVISFDLNGVVLDANDNFLNAVKYKLREVRGEHHSMFVGAEEASGLDYKEFWRSLANGIYQAGTYKRLGKSGQEVWLQATYNPIFDMNGRLFRIVKYASDVTRHTLKQVSDRGQIEAIHRSQGVIEFSLDGYILDVNQNLLDMLGYRFHELVGNHHRILVKPDYSETEDYRHFWKTLRSGQFLSTMYKCVGNNNKELWLKATYNPILDLNGNPIKIIKFATDATSDVAIVEAFHEAREQAQHDPATALPNRVQLGNFLDAALARPAQRVTVFFLDLDLFKSVNDTYGHHAGDQVLGQIADRLRKAVTADQLVARVGGDEFVVVAPDYEDSAIGSMCERLIAAISVPVFVEQAQVSVGLSIGVAISPQDGTTPDDLLKKADLALYRAKKRGKGTYCCYSEALNERLLECQFKADELRVAIGNGELFLVYQPRFSASTMKINCLEASVQWNHPTRGVLTREKFIPTAANSGLIAFLDEWVIQNACEAAIGRHKMQIAVSLSFGLFQTGNPTAFITRALDTSGLSPERLEITIKESLLMEDPARIKDALSELKALGVKIVIDDFGTGCSSMGTLRSFPFDAIKIDGQVVADIGNRHGGRAIVQAIVVLGKALGASVIANGVASEAQLTMLMTDGCSELQGDLLSEPLASDQLSDFLERRSADSRFEAVG